jgi:hypothetical protein
VNISSAKIKVLQNKRTVAEAYSDAYRHLEAGLQLAE